MIWLTPGVARRIFTHASNDVPNEACGLVIGRAGEAPRAVALTNVDPNPQTGYLAHPEELGSILVRAISAGEQLLAIYHSHPNGSTIPSRRDVADWGYPESVMLIAGRDGDSFSLAAWRVEYGRVERLDVIVSDTRPADRQAAAYTPLQRALLVMTAVIAAAVVIGVAMSLLPPPVVP